MLNYNIRISAVKDGNHEYNFNIDSKFFESFNNSEVTNSQIKATVVLYKDGNRYKLTLHFEGEIYNLMCDLCASEMKISINNSISVLLQETEEDLYDTDEIIYLKPNQYELDISQLLYEGIVIYLPSKREHNGEEGNKCDEEMMALLDRYAEKNEEKNDPLRDELNKLKDLI